MNGSFSSMITKTIISVVACFLGATPLMGQGIEWQEGFENFAAGQTPAEWSWKFGTGSHDISEVAYNGSRSLHFKTDDPNYWSLSTDYFELTPGKTYVLTAQVKVNECDTVASMRLVSKIDERGRDKYVRGDVSKVFKYDHWTQVTGMLDVPASSGQVRLEICTNKACEGWIDDIKIAPWQRPAGTKIPQLTDQRLAEKLDRGMWAVSSENGLHISWRLLDSDSAEAAFDLYRKTADSLPVKINTAPITLTTDFTDTDIDKNTAYSYTAVSAGAKPSTDTHWSLPTQYDPKKIGYRNFALKGKYAFRNVGLGDVDGDGQLDYIVKQPDINVDPYSAPGYWKKSTDTFNMEAYRHDGTLLWDYDLGWSIEAGTWYSPMIVYDLNGDGRCEVISKTGKGDPRDSEGKVVDCEEFLTIFDGLTGKVLAQTDYLPKRHEIYGPKAYNYYDSRNQFAIAYLDGKTPCLIVERGTYDLIIVQAFWLDGTEIKKLWQWRSSQWPKNNWGQGAHSIRAADVDSDGRDEVLIGSVMLDDDGTTLWTTGQGHPDHCYLGDLDPTRPGLEIYMGLETRQKKDGYGMVDAATGKRIWGWNDPTSHIHDSGLVSDLDPTLPGVECYGRDKNKGNPLFFWFDAKGNLIEGEGDLDWSPRAAYWDADPQRELLVKSGIKKFRGDIIGPPLEGRHVLFADIVGDWREEIICSVDGQMRIYSTPIPATSRHRCLLQDSIYRMDVAAQANGYRQVPTLSYDLASQPKAKPEAK